jgi:hypothetical protein
VSAFVPLADFTFYNVVLAVHIGAVVVAFGALFAYPIFFGVATRSDPRALPALHRAQRNVGGRLMSFGLLFVVAAGLYLAAKDHAFKYFYVQWGIGAALLIGGISGSYFTPREKRLLELSERDAGPAGDAGGGTITLSTEYEALARQMRGVTALTSVLVLVTVLIMATHLGGP